MVHPVQTPVKPMGNFLLQVINNTTEHVGTLWHTAVGRLTWSIAFRGKDLEEQTKD